MDNIYLKGWGSQKAEREGWRENSCKPLAAIVMFNWIGIVLRCCFVIIDGYWLNSKLYPALESIDLLIINSNK